MVTGLEEGLFPLGPQSYEIEELEEERRLYYVAVTRAQQKVYLSYANARRRFGGHPMPAVQSRFINELPEELVSGATRTASDYSEKIYSKPTASHTSLSDEFAIGDHVEHKLFGKGKVIAVEGGGDTAKLTILFSGNVRKKLIAKYAKLVQFQA